DPQRGEQASAPRRYAYAPSGRSRPDDASRPFARDPGDPRRFAIDPSRPFANDPSDPRRYAYDPNDPHSPLIYNPTADRHTVYINEPEYPRYRLTTNFDHN